MFAIVLEIFVEASILTLVSTSLAAGSFMIHAVFCAACFIIAIIGGLKRKEDQFVAGSGQRRYFMTFGHATVWAFFAGIVILILN